MNRGRHRKKKYTIKIVNMFEIPLYKRTNNVTNWLRTTFLYASKQYKLYLNKEKTICQIEAVTENQNNI